MSKIRYHEYLNAGMLRKEASRLASLANKRIQRLERRGLVDSPAYQKWLADGGQKFGVKGKTFNEVQQEMSRLRQFVDSQTSTIRGYHSVLKDIAANTGIKYNKIGELYSRAEKFFELSSKVEQYLRTVEDMASAIGYQKIWEAINEYVQESGTELEDADANMDQMVQTIAEALKGQQQQIKTIARLSDDDWILLGD